MTPTVTSPHIKSTNRTSRLMAEVILALLPAWVYGCIHFGPRALLVTAVSVACAVACEALCCLALHKPLTVTDGSAAITGLLLAMTLPSTVPLWQVAVGDVFAILVIKCLCGGLGQNILNPALAARAFMMLIYPVGVTVYPHIDAVSAATPMHQMAMHALPSEDLLSMLLGNRAGSIGETCALALLAGGAYLVWRKVISLRIPLTYIGTVAVLSLIFARGDNALVWMLYSVLGGGLLLGAVFMATDYVTSPVTPIGQLIYGVGCGVLTFLFRRFGLYPEGVTYAILLMNLFSWTIDRCTAPRRFGTKKLHRKGVDTQ